MRVMGVDPGTREAGFGVIEQNGNRMSVLEYGVISAPRKDPVAARLRSIYEGLHQAIRKHRPDILSLEAVFYGKNVASALRMGEARGVAILAAATENVEVVEYAPALVKKAAVGQGRASKERVQEMVRILLGLPRLPTPDHAADALALAVCHCNRSRFDSRAPAEMSKRRGRRTLGGGKRP